MENIDQTSSHPITNKVNVNLDMLGSLMLNRVQGHVDRPDVVTIDNSGFGWWAPKLVKKVSNSACFG